MWGWGGVGLKKRPARDLALALARERLEEPWAKGGKGGFKKDWVLRLDYRTVEYAQISAINSKKKTLLSR